MGRKKNQQLWNKLTKELNDFKIEAGWFENTKYDDDTSVGFVARIQNYGCRISVTNKQRTYLHYLGIHLKKSTGEIIIPPRPFMDNAKEKVKKEGEKIVLQELLRVFALKQTMVQATHRLGLWLKGIIQEEIIKLNSPALSNATLEIRNHSDSTTSGNTKPLQATGIMLNTVSYKVDKK